MRKCFLTIFFDFNRLIINHLQYISYKQYYPKKRKPKIFRVWVSHTFMK